MNWLSSSLSVPDSWATPANTNTLFRLGSYPTSWSWSRRARWWRPSPSTAQWQEFEPTRSALTPSWTLSRQTILSKSSSLHLASLLPSIPGNTFLLKMWIFERIGSPSRSLTGWDQFRVSKLGTFKINMSQVDCSFLAVGLFILKLLCFLRQKTTFTHFKNNNNNFSITISLTYLALPQEINIS